MTEPARARILAAAAAVFQQQGYEAATLKGIAAAAGVSGAALRAHFAHKADVGLALYDHWAAEAAAQMQSTEAGPVAARYHAVMRSRLMQLAPHRSALSGLFGAAMQPDSGIAIVRPRTKDADDPLHAAFSTLVAGATDAPRTAEQTSHLAALLYSAHLATLVFWLYDRTPGQRATQGFLDLSREGLAFARGALVLPPVSKGLGRVAALLESVFSGRAAPGT